MTELYADDVLLYSAIHSEADCICLQENLNLLYQWSVIWLMYFNPVKREFRTLLTITITLATPSLSR